MVRKFLWPFLILIFFVMGGFYLFVTRSACDAACLQQAVLGAVILLSLGSGGLLYLLTNRISQPLMQVRESLEQLGRGETIAHIVTAEQDEVGQLVTAFNHTAQQVLQKQAILAQEQQQLQLVLRQMADGVLFADQDGRVMLLNKAAAKLLDVKRKKAFGRTLAEVLRHHELIAIWQRSQESGTEQTATIEAGTDLFLQAVVTPFQDDQSTGYLFVLQDLTQIHHLQTIRRDFISNISHELRAPLAALRAVVETLQDGALDDPPAAERFLGSAEKEIDTLTQMVEELLELSRIESGQIPIKLTKTPIPNLLLSPLDRIQPLAKRADVELILDLRANLPRVWADTPRIQQVMINLLHNAVKFTPAGGKVTLLARLNKKETDVVIIVKDTGIGIPASDLPRVFERFYKSDRARTRQQGGTGLGLAIARHIIEAHNGTIRVKSRLDKGSTFSFTLPVCK
ncbi:MAG TPA: HAMP domain-containing sensor histidine kinase [Anaerolineae bacterium]|nr:HAMP domain-containing sensor histidine kinase [Anaerolineae bacterium]